MGEAYSDFARVYDIFMDETPYESWCAFIDGQIRKYGISRPVLGRETVREEPGTGDPGEKSGEERRLLSEKNLVLDLGCGTGTLTEMLADMGYDMIGIDSSADMLEAAVEKSRRAGHETLYLMQDMRDLELYSTVGTVISVCDSLNYILDEDELLGVFRLVANYLFPGGIFLFDFNTVYKYAEVIGDATIAENREECSFIWENYYHEEEQINEYDVTVFVREDGGKERYRRFSETHYQRGYTVRQMLSLLERAQLETLLVLDADTRDKVTEKSERVYIVARSRKEG